MSVGLLPNKILPPVYKTPPGRTIKLRKKKVDEKVSHSKLTRKKKCYHEG